MSFTVWGWVCVTSFGLHLLVAVAVGEQPYKRWQARRAKRAKQRAAREEAAAKKLQEYQEQMDRIFLQQGE